MNILQAIPVADPGFPVGGGGHGPPTRVLFGENVCKNERIGSRRGERAPGMPLDLPMDPLSNKCSRLKKWYDVLVLNP